jgi:DNA uptake protein ComE-like DNA-binding protein
MKFLRRFDKHDRDAVIVLVLVIVVSVVVFPFLSERHDTASRKDPSAHSKFSSRSEYSDYSEQSAPPSLRPFDPNTASEQQLLSLGLSPRHVRNIIKYRLHGGRFRKKEDFARLYGLTLKQYRQLEPYITILPEVMAADVIKGRQDTLKNQIIPNTQNNLNPPIAPKNASTKLRYGETVDINTADTAMLKRIPGIGSYYAMRIVELRQRRQMFSSPQELLTIRDFPETALVYMTASQNFPEIYVNLWSQKQLAAHPLLNYAQAREIITLRRTGGTITAASDLAALPSLDARTMERITPFLRFDTAPAAKLTKE